MPICMEYEKGNRLAINFSGLSNHILSKQTSLLCVLTSNAQMLRTVQKTSSSSIYWSDIRELRSFPPMLAWFWCVRPKRAPMLVTTVHATGMVLCELVHSRHQAKCKAETNSSVHSDILQLCGITFCMVPCQPQYCTQRIVKFLLFGDRLTATGSCKDTLVVLWLSLFCPHSDWISTHWVACFVWEQLEVGYSDRPA